MMSIIVHATYLTPSLVVGIVYRLY